MKTKFLLFVLLISQIGLSQTLSDLEKMKDSLELKRSNLTREAIDIIKVIDSVERLILFARIRNKSVKSIAKKDASVFKELYNTKDVIGKIKRKDTIYVIEYKSYFNSFEILYKNQLGYIKKNKIRLNNKLEKLISNKKSSNSNSSSSSYSSFLISSNKSKKTYSRKKNISRSYIRGPRGGCYYINSNGNKTYVSRSLCN